MTPTDPIQRGEHTPRLAEGQEPMRQYRSQNLPPEPGPPSSACFLSPSRFFRLNQTDEGPDAVIYSSWRSRQMEKLPTEAVELYNLFIHGVISRRAFMDGVQKFAVGGLAAA